MDLPIVLNRQASVPLKHQLYDEIRRLILCGIWTPGYKLPSTRILAEKLDISRPTIHWAFAELLNEGYIQTFTGSGTIVSRDLPVELLHDNKGSKGKAQKELAMITNSLSNCGEYLSKQGKLLDQLGTPLGIQPGYEASKFEIDFRETPPSIANFPIIQWQKLLIKNWSKAQSIVNFTQNAKGYYPLRQAISEYIFKARGIRCIADQIIILGGTQQALNLIARVHLNQGEAVAIEDPGYNGARYIFESYAAQVWPVPVDESGLDVSTLKALDTIKFKLLYLTPTHQVPLGSMLSLARRLQVINWAQQKGTIIVEDDYDGEYRYAGNPIPALAALDDTGQAVIYVRTFSKALFPSLRIGYVVVPEKLIDIYTWAKKLDDSYSPILEQMVLADFISSGSFEKYIRRMRKVYGNKRRLLEQSLKEIFGDAVSILGESAGISLAVRFKTSLDDQTITKELAKVGVGIRSTSRDYLANTYTKSEFFMGYGNVDEKLIAEGVQRMARVIIDDRKSQKK